MLETKRIDRNKHINLSTPPPSENPRRFNKERKALMLHGVLGLVVSIYCFYCIYTVLVESSVPFLLGSGDNSGRRLVPHHPCAEGWDTGRNLLHGRPQEMKFSENGSTSIYLWEFITTVSTGYSRNC
jgi:hypothetical protein